MRKLTISISIGLLAGCTVGPKYDAPTVPLPKTFEAADAPTFKREPVATDVWKSFGDPTLDQLIAQALAQNLSIAEARARLNEVRSLRGLTTFALFPTVTAAGDKTKNSPSRLDPQIPPDIGGTETYNAGFDSVWEIDLFGSLRNQSNAIVQRTDAADAALRASELQMIAETAQAYFALRGAQTRLALQERNVANLGENLDLLKLRLEVGRTSQLDVSRSDALGLGVAALLPEIRAEVTRQRQRLAVLTGQSADQLPAALNDSRALPALPNWVQVGTPDDWIRRRPDVANAERELAAAYSDTGAEVAEFFPKLNLLGSFGYTSPNSSDLGKKAAQRWRFGPSLSWRFLDFGRVRQNVRATQAVADQVEARYRQTVLRALEETESALANYRAASETEAILDRAVDQSKTAYDLAKLRFDAGASDFLVLLDAERQLIDFEDRQAQNQTRRATTLAALYKALAGDFVRAAP
jgi:outer membrane protein, multidrug efflux system